MYCILALPRTASTSAWSYINTAMILSDVKYKDYTSQHCEPFNPKYKLSASDEQALSKEFINSNPRPIIKILTNHTYKIAFNFIGTPGYKCVFLEPSNIKENVLKTMIMRRTQQYFGDRKSEREKLLGKLSFTIENIRYVLEKIQRHMTLKELCDYKFYSDDVIINPNENFLSKLGLPKININNFKYTSAYYDDIMLLRNVDEFESNWNIAYKMVFSEP
jgi:hypothetical protein